MKNLIVASALVFGAVQAKADGFVCQATDESLNVKVYNHVQPEDGTRNGAVMVLSDPSVAYGRRTIARFSSVSGTLANIGARYVAKVDLRFTDSARTGELIGGTKLGELKTIVLDVHHLMSEPVGAGTAIAGLVTLQKRDGDAIKMEVECKRYLKGVE